ncbi:MAG TPA: hypothetical protein VFT50_17715 [Baekduia sp.]|nr:hypothetical protein [Baekduia sp.]
MRADARAPAAERGLRRRLEAHLGSRDVARVIYGAIIGLALVLAFEAHPPTATQAAGGVAGTALAVGLAEIYSEVIGTEARTRHAVSARQLRALWEDAAAVMLGAAFPAVFFVLAATNIIGLDLAFTLAKWSGLGLICGYGFLAARLAGAGHGRALAHAAAVGAVGGVLIALKALLH